MHVRLIDYTGKGQPNPEVYAQNLLIYVKNTRVTQGMIAQRAVANLSDEERAKEIIAIANTIRSSWEFIHFTWEITGVTRAFTHQFVRSRHFSFAQQAMRVADMSEFESLCPDTVKAKGKEGFWKLTMQMIASAYSELRKADIPAQDARGVLPTNVLTNIIASGNLRAFADMTGKRLNIRVQDEYQEVVRKMIDTVYEVHHWTKDFLEPDRANTPALNALLRAALGDKAPVEVPSVNDALKELDRLKGTWG